MHDECTYLANYVSGREEAALLWLHSPGPCYVHHFPLRSFLAFSILTKVLRGNLVWESLSRPSTLSHCLNKFEILPGH